MSAIRVTRKTTGSESARQIHAFDPSPAGTVAPPARQIDPLHVLAEAALGTTRTRSGRVSKHTYTKMSKYFLAHYQALSNV